MEVLVRFLVQNDALLAQRKMMNKWKCWKKQHMHVLRVCSLKTFGHPLPWSDKLLIEIFWSVENLSQVKTLFSMLRVLDPASPLKLFAYLVGPACCTLQVSPSPPLLFSSLLAAQLTQLSVTCHVTHQAAPGRTQFPPWCWVIFSNSIASFSMNSLKKLGPMLSQSTWCFISQISTHINCH